MNVIITPKSCHTDQDILDVLIRHGVTDYVILAPGFVSATLPTQAAWQDVGLVGRVDVKAAKQMHVCTGNN